LSANNFTIDFVQRAELHFKIRSIKWQANKIICEPIIEDKNGKIYKPKKQISDQAYEKAFNPFSIFDKRRYK